MSEAVVDQTGIARTETGEIAPPPAATSESSTTPAASTPNTSTTPAAATQADDGKSLLNKDAPAPATGAPETYEEFKVPEGFTLDTEVAKEAGTIFKGMNLTQTQAQSLIDFYVAKTQETLQQPYKAYQDMREGWQNQVKNDPEIGGKLDQVKQTVARALDSLGDPGLARDFREAMDITGAGDNPAFVRAFYRLAQKVTEGRPTQGNGPAKAGQAEPGARPASAGKALYPNLS